MFMYAEGQLAGAPTTSVANSENAPDLVSSIDRFKCIPLILGARAKDAFVREQRQVGYSVEFLGKCCGDSLKFEPLSPNCLGLFQGIYLDKDIVMQFFDAIEGWSIRSDRYGNKTATVTYPSQKPRFSLGIWS